MFDRCLYFNSNVLIRRVEKIWKKAFSELNLAPAHAYLLRLVLTQPGLPQKELADILVLDKSTITRFVDKMIEEGYLQRAPSVTGNLKEQCIYPTPKAEALRDRLTEIGNALYKRMQDLLSADQLKDSVGWMRQAAEKLA